MTDDMDGLPGALPPGERILWQGRPCWKTLARRAFHVRKLAVYFAILLVWYAATSFMSAEDTRQAALATLRMAGIALVPLGLIYAFAWMSSRATVYTVTDRRVVLSAGIALPMTINLPFCRIEAAGADVAPDGFGSIVLKLLPTERLAYLAVWPHARPWRMARPEPMLRCIPEAARVSQMLARALAASAGMQVQASRVGTATSISPQSQISALA